MLISREERALEEARTCGKRKELVENIGLARPLGGALRGPVLDGVQQVRRVGARNVDRRVLKPYAFIAALRVSVQQAPVLRERGGERRSRWRAVPHAQRERA